MPTILWWILGAIGWLAGFLVTYAKGTKGMDFARRANRVGTCFFCWPLVMFLATFMWLWDCYEAAGWLLARLCDRILGRNE
jgi:hypothetical protein